MITSGTVWVAFGVTSILFEHHAAWWARRLVDLLSVLSAAAIPLIPHLAIKAAIAAGALHGISYLFGYAGGLLVTFFASVAVVGLTRGLLTLLLIYYMR